MGRAEDMDRWRLKAIAVLTANVFLIESVLAIPAGKPPLQNGNGGRGSRLQQPPCQKSTYLEVKSSSVHTPIPPSELAVRSFLQTNVGFVNGTEVITFSDSVAFAVRLLQEGRVSVYDYTFVLNEENPGYGYRPLGIRLDEANVYVARTVSRRGLFKSVLDALRPPADEIPAQPVVRESVTPWRVGRRAVLRSSLALSVLAFILVACQQVGVTPPAAITAAVTPGPTITLPAPPPAAAVAAPALSEEARAEVSRMTALFDQAVEAADYSSEGRVFSTGEFRDMFREGITRIFEINEELGLRIIPMIDTIRFDLSIQSQAVTRDQDTGRDVMLINPDFYNSLPPGEGGYTSPVQGLGFFLQLENDGWVPTKAEFWDFIVGDFTATAAHEAVHALQNKRGVLVYANADEEAIFNITQTLDPNAPRHVPEDLIERTGKAEVEADVIGNLFAPDGGDVQKVLHLFDRNAQGRSFTGVFAQFADRTSRSEHIDHRIYAGLNALDEHVRLNNVRIEFAEFYQADERITAMQELTHFGREYGEEWPNDTDRMRAIAGVLALEQFLNELEVSGVEPIRLQAKSIHNETDVDGMYRGMVAVTFSADIGGRETQGFVRFDMRDGVVIAETAFDMWDALGLSDIAGTRLDDFVAQQEAALAEPAMILDYYINGQPGRARVRTGVMPDQLPAESFLAIETVLHDYIVIEEILDGVTIPLSTSSLILPETVSQRVRGSAAVSVGL